jgi:hypothetical protein
VRDDDLSRKEGRARKERNKRNIALALALGGIVVLFYLMSIVQWREHFGH